MQLRCTYCQTMFALSRDEKLAAIQEMNTENLQYYHAHCPKCRRANRVERLKLERSQPNWREELKKMEKEALRTEKETVEAIPPQKESLGQKTAPASPPKKKPGKPAGKK